jgi:hypothetical protein
MGFSGGYGRFGRVVQYIGLGIICLGLANCASSNVASHSGHKTHAVAAATHHDRGYVRSARSDCGDPTCSDQVKPAQLATAKNSRGHSQIAYNRADCSDPTCADRPHSRRMTGALSSYASVDYSAVVGSRPAGCPHQFCGCEASRYVFGKIRPELNLASNWGRFPRTAPASGMVAVRNHHVMVLMRHEGGNNWLVHDGNSGNGLTREHVIPISGYTIVNPRGG